MSTKSPSKRSSKLPSIFWHKGERQFVSKIGWKKVPRADGDKLVRDFQRLGKDESAAMTKALRLKADWVWTVNHFKTSETLRAVKPYWLPKNLADLYRRVEARPGDLDVMYGDPSLGYILAPGEEEEQAGEDQLREAQARRLTLAEAKDLFLTATKARVGLAGGKGISEYSFTNYKYELEQSLRFIDTGKTLFALTRADLETLVNSWMALPEKLTQPGKRISVRTAANYCKGFKKLIDWMDNHENLGFIKPKGTDAIFRFRNFNPIDIRPYKNDELKAIFAAHPEQFRIYPQLAVNCGYYQIDLATLRHDHLVTLRNGIEEPVENVRTFNGDVYIKRRRQKTLHQNDFETLCYVWPENVELLRKYAAPRDNAHGLLMLNENGLPLQRNKTNNITNRFQRYRKDAKLPRGCAFKQFRKTGATWITNHVGERVARMYNAHTLAGELKRYAAQDFAPLTEALKSWRAELLGADVLHAASCGILAGGYSMSAGRSCGRRAR